MSRSKLVFPGGYVKVRPMLNKRFPVASSVCVDCGYMSCATSFYHLNTQLVRCLECHGNPWEGHEEDQAPTTWYFNKKGTE